MSYMQWGEKAAQTYPQNSVVWCFLLFFVVLVSHRPRVPGHFQVHVSITGSEWWVLPNDTGGEKSVNYTFEYS